MIPSQFVGPVTLRQEGGGKNFNFSSRLSHSNLDEYFVSARASARRTTPGSCGRPRRMRQLVREKSQFIIATHSPILMAYPDALILGFGPEGIAPIAYEDTEHFRVTRDFLADREGVLRRLFEGG